jgi:hypothetical protein
MTTCFKNANKKFKWLSCHLSRDSNFLNQAWQQAVYPPFDKRESSRDVFQPSRGLSCRPRLGYFLSVQRTPPFIPEHCSSASYHRNTGVKVNSSRRRRVGKEIGCLDTPTLRLNLRTVKRQTGRWPEGVEYGGNYAGESRAAAWIAYYVPPRERLHLSCNAHMDAIISLIA